MAYVTKWELKGINHPYFYLSTEWILLTLLCGTHNSICSTQLLSTFKRRLRTRLFTETHPSPLRRSQTLQLLVDTLHERMLNIECCWMLNNIVDTDVELLIAFSCGYIVLRKQKPMEPNHPATIQT